MYSSTSPSTSRPSHAPHTPRSRHSKSLMTPPPSPPDEHRFAAPSSRSALHPSIHRPTLHSSTLAAATPPRSASSESSAHSSTVSSSSYSRRASSGAPHPINTSLAQSYRRNDELLSSRSPTRKTYGTAADARKPSLNGDFLRHPPPVPNARRSTLGGLEPAFPSSSRLDPRRPSLQPRSAVANYFNLDFSFLDNEPPPSSASSSSSAFPGRPPSVHSLSRSQSAKRPESVRSNSGGPLRDILSSKVYNASTDSLDGSGWSSRSRNAPESPNSLRSASSRRLPFPSKPQSISSSRGRPTTADSRADSSGASMTRSKSLHSTTRRPSSQAYSTYSPPPQSVASRDSIIETRRPSEVPSLDSVRSSEVSTSGSDPDLAFKRARGFSPDRAAAAVFSGYSLGNGTSTHAQAPAQTEDEKRKRLVLFLDETAAAMEGGKSLSMVLPEAHSEKEQLSLSQLAEVASPSLTPAASYSFSAHSLHARPDSTLSSPTTPSFDPRTTPQPGGLPGQARRDERPSQNFDDFRSTVYFTPTVPSAPSPGKSTPSDQSQDELDSEVDRGLGLGMDFRSTNLRLPNNHGSPSSFGTQTPSMSPATTQQEERTASVYSVVDPKAAKKAEQRRRTIQELIDTEASYASDMAVARDIYLARARGADMNAVADHVMSSGLGLPSLVGESPPSPPPSATFQDMLHSGPTAPRNDARRPSMARRPSFAPPAMAAGEALISSKNLHVVFANLEQIADLAEAFSGVLDGAWTNDSDDDTSDRIGEVFVEMLPRISQVYTYYCTRHHSAIVRLQELSPSLTGYFAECKMLCQGRTNSWDLPSLLIKPVQRCLKYPLLLESIINLTPLDHPDRESLLRARTDMLRVADQINESKKQHDVVERVIKKDAYARRESTASVLTKKLLRSGQKVKQAMTSVELAEKDDMFDTLAALVDTTRSGALRFANDMRDWTKKTKNALETQVALVEGWIEVYAPMQGEGRSGEGHERLTVFLENVLKPVLAGPWRDLDHEIRRTLLVKTEHLISMYENPRSCILKRNDLLLAHSRYLTKKSLTDRKASEEFVSATTQLVTELPPFLSQVSRYFNIIVEAFADTQAIYHLAVSERWNQFAEQWCTQIPGGPYDAVEAEFAARHQPLESMMETLRRGLDLPSSKSTSLKSSRDSPARSPADLRSTSSQATTRHHRHSTASYQGSRLSMRSMDYRPSSPNGYGTNRSSVNSTSSTAPSFSVSNNSTASSSSPTPMTPPPPPSATLKRGSLGGGLVRPSIYRTASEQSFRYDNQHPLPPVPLFTEQEKTPIAAASPPSRSLKSPTTTVVRSPASTTRPLSQASVRSSSAARPPSSLTQRGENSSPLQRQRSESVASPTPTNGIEQADEEHDEDTFEEDPNVDYGRPRPEIGRRGVSDSRFESTMSVYAEASEGYDEDELEEGAEMDDGVDEDDDEGGILYVAQAMASSQGNGYRSGFPLLSFEIGDRLHVEAEEADKAEGGSGWLLGTRDDGVRGWARTEHFHIVEEE